MAAMKTAVGRIYSLFNACIPDNKKIKKRLMICKIVESREYNILKTHKDYSITFLTYFSEDILESFDAEKLEEISQIIPRLITLFNAIYDFSQYGDATKITKNDLPDLYSLESINALIKKLATTRDNPNITNITRGLTFTLFSDKLIKNPVEVLETLTEEDMSDPVSAIKKRMNETYYCIKSDEMTDSIEEYTNKISGIKNELKKCEQNKYNLRKKKVFFISIIILLLILANELELIYPSSGYIFNIATVLICVIYFFIG